MTICIAAICEAGKSIVVVADRMFTNPFLSVEFETEERKIEELPPKCVALTAGNSPVATEILDVVRLGLQAGHQFSVPQVAELVRKVYADIRARKVEETLITPNLAADYARQRAGGVTLPAYLQPQPQVYQMIFAQVGQQNLGVDLLVAGIDPTGAHLFQVANPGVLYTMEKLGYAAIGSGGIHAATRLSLAGQTRRRDLFTTLADVYTAKRASEVAPGVGKATDIAVINNERGVWYCPQVVFDELEKIHGSTVAKETPNLDPLRKKCDELWKQPAA
jgi:20S proteasome alpha/beta subunit